MKTIVENRGTIFKLIRQGLSAGLNSVARPAVREPVPEQPH